MNLGSVNFDASAWHAFARKMMFLGFDEENLTIDCGMDSVIAAHKSAWAGNLRSASLADENFASFNLLTAKALDAKSLAGIVV